MSPREHQPRTPLPLSQREWLDQLGDDFQRQWRAGKTPRIEVFLERANGADRGHLLRELLTLELDLRAEAGERIDQAAYLERFPLNQSIVHSILEAGRSSPAFEDTETLVFPAGAGNYGTPAVHADADAELPPAIGRYEILRRLGQGAFAIVYLARDSQLDRQVALKVPRLDRFRTEEALELFLQEARHAAQLDHPGIVRVYDVQREPGLLYIVMQYIGGGDLGAYAKSHRLSPTQLAQLVIEIAEAVGHASTRGYVHRDLKPANILVDEHGRPHVADFGLALHESVQRDRAGELAGTYPYMSPEQVRRESHRLDGRSDIWGLGVIFYELLTGNRPFAGETRQQLLDEIQNRDPKPPRQVNPEIPRELSRICLACLAKRATDRYQSAADLIDDLRCWIQAESERTARGQPIKAEDHSDKTAPVKIVPRGLRSFDAGDSDFFLELLPGPRDRAGLPKTIRFWKTQLERTDAEETFAVGLMYGPSGCGKSSLVKAGLIPRLNQDVLPVYVEATGDDTEVRLIKSLRKHCPGLPDRASLPEHMAHLRDSGGSQGRKVVLIIDQFEQWLHACSAMEDSQLVMGLRQCDGTRVQAVVLVRDDFWMSATRFMQELEVPLVEGYNSAAVDLFDLDHARGVLAVFGRVYGKLPELPAEPDNSQNRFLDQAVDGLSRGGKIICVHLAVFAEMMKDWPWTEESLQRIGGTEGVGTTFLEETFSARTAPPSHRLHQNAVRAVLRALLPERGTDIRGQMKSYDDLMQASGYGDRHAEFDTVLRILNTELRLITPTEPDGTADHDTATAAASPAKFYQLTHDYLVQSLHTWLTREQRKTRRGRAEVHLDERARLWDVRREAKQLPSVAEWLTILLLTRHGSWNSVERPMMRVASKRHLRRISFLCAVIVVAGLLGYSMLARFNSAALRDRLLSADVREVPEIVAEMESLRWWLTPMLRESYGNVSTDPARCLNISLALLRFGDDKLDFLLPRLLEASPSDFDVIVHALSRRRDKVADLLWKRIEDSTAPTAQRFRAACAIAMLEPTSARWMKHSESVAMWLVSEPIHQVAEWSGFLRSGAQTMTPALTEIFRHGTGTRRTAATIALANLLDHQEQKLLDLLFVADATQVRILTSKLDPKSKDCLRILEDTLLPTQALGPSSDAEGDSDDLKRKANAASALLLLGRSEPVWGLLKTGGCFNLRAAVVERISQIGVDPTLVLNRLIAEGDSSARQSLILSLAGRLPDGSAVPASQEILPTILAIYRNDPDPGVHSAAQWVLRVTEAAVSTQASDAPLPGYADRNQRHWYVNELGHIMLILPTHADVLLPSAPAAETSGTAPAPAGRGQIAIASTETTLAQFRRFRPTYRTDLDFAPDDSCPASSVSFSDAMQYCLWLSNIENIPQKDQCYFLVDESDPRSIQPRADYLERSGYRLPTEKEWLYACRGGHMSDNEFILPDSLLSSYEWFYSNSQGRMWPVGMLKPNVSGFFDMRGNLSEWCHRSGNSKPGSDISGGLRLLRGACFRTMGKSVWTVSGTEAVSQGFPFVGFRIARTCP